MLFLVPAISQTHKSLENSQDFFVKTKTKTLGLKTKTSILFFVLEAPRDQDFGLEDYITGEPWNRLERANEISFRPTCDDTSNARSTEVKVKR